MSLKYKIVITFFVLQAALLTVVVWQIESVTSVHARVRLADADKHMLDLLANLSRAALVDSDYASLVERFKELQKDAHVETLVLADAGGRVVAGTNAELLGRPLPALESTADRYWKRIRIVGGSGRRGTLAVHYSEVPFLAHDRAVWIRGVGISLIGLLMITAVGMFIGFLLTRRLNRLAFLANAAAAGNLDIDLRLPGNDETARLSSAFNRMFRALNEQISYRRNEEDRFRDLAASAADWYWETDENHRFSWISEQFTNHGNLTVDDVIGRTHWELVGVDPNDDPDLGRLVEDLQARRPFRDFRYSRTGASGRELHRVANGIPRFDDAGDFIGYRGTGTDITARVELERAYRNIVEGSPVSTLVHDGERIIFANAACAELYLAESPDEMIGKQIIELIHPEARAGHRARIADLLATRKPLPRTLQRRVRLDGSEMMVQTVGMPIVWDHKPAILGMHVDVSDLVDMQEALRRSEERYRNLVDLTPAAVLVQTNGVIRFANRAAVEMFLAGSADELVGMSSLDTVHPDSRPTALADRHKIKETQEVSEFMEVRRLRLDGTPFYSAGKAGPISWEGEDGQLVVVQDVTDQKEAEEALRNAEAERFRHATEMANVQRRSILGEMASAMAHELNQPMTAIVNYANGAVRRLAGTGDSNPELTEALEQVCAQASRASKIVRWARRFAQNSKIERHEESLNDLIRSALVFVEPELAQSGIPLDVELCEATPVAMVNDVEFEQVCLNLIRNAIEALQDTPREARRIAVRTEMDGTDRVVITVTDTGAGIPRVITERIFEPFFTTKEQGVGMGLAICRTIIEDHGGQLLIDRTGADGTAFKLVLPIVREASTHAA